MTRANLADYSARAESHRARLELERHPNRSAAGILWTAGGIRPIPVLGTLARELRAEADGYRAGRRPSTARARQLKQAAATAETLRRQLEQLDTITD